MKHYRWSDGAELDWTANRTDDVWLQVSLICSHSKTPAKMA